MGGPDTSPHELGTEMAARQMSRGASSAILFGMHPRLTATTLVVLLAALFATVGLLASGAGPALAAGGGEAPKCGGGTILLNSKEKAAFSLHNKIRRDRNLKPFCVHPKLQKAARSHSRDMIERDYFSHDTKGGDSFDARLKAFGYAPDGYRYYATGENIAYGSGPYGEPANIMDAWMKSDGHRHNILKAEFREIGVGTYAGTYGDTDGATMYTADFGVRRR
jgi:uncharacterized protein YkwD